MANLHNKPPCKRAVFLTFEKFIVGRAGKIGRSSHGEPSRSHLAPYRALVQDAKWSSANALATDSSSASVGDQIVSRSCLERGRSKAASGPSRHMHRRKTSVATKVPSRWFLPIAPCLTFWEPRKSVKSQPIVAAQLLRQAGFKVDVLARRIRRSRWLVSIEERQTSSPARRGAPLSATARIPRSQSDGT